MARLSDADIGAWSEASRLNVAGGAANHLDDPRVPAAFTAMGEHLGGAMANLERLVGAGVPATNAAAS
jgi:hypothetical protein